MPRSFFRVLVLSALSLLAIIKVASSQTDVPAGLVGKTIAPGIEISYAGDTSTRKFENNRPNSTPVKTFVYPDGHEKSRIEDGFMKGALALDAEYPRSFDVGTEFKIANVKLEKQDIELILTPTSAGDKVGDVKLVLGSGYSTKSNQELIEEINRMLKVGSVAPRKTTAVTSTPVTLDCTPNQEMVNSELEEVIFDEASRTATFQTVGKPKQMQPAVFTDAQIQWNNGSPGTGREFYSLNRSNGVLAIKNTDTTMARVTGNSSLAHDVTMLFTCAVRTKKF